MESAAAVSEAHNEQLHVTNAHLSQCQRVTSISAGDQQQGER